jgi:hypothetical protein
MRVLLKWMLSLSIGKACEERQVNFACMKGIFSPVHVFLCFHVLCLSTFLCICVCC